MFENQMSKTNDTRSVTPSGSGTLPLPNTTTRPELLDNENDNQFRQMIQDLTSLCGRLDQVRTKFAKRLGISGPQYNVFVFVAHNQGDDGITVSKVADGLLVTGAYVTKEVNHLIAMGFMTKTPNPDDGRSVLLQVSDHGAQSLSSLSHALQNVNDEIFKSLDHERFLMVSRTVHQIVADAERTAKKVSYYLDD